MYQIAVQSTRDKNNSDISIPSSVKFKRWAKVVLQDKLASAELTIRIVDTDEMTELNSTFRHKNKPTNVLSFPLDIPAEFNNDIPLLGDIVICAEVIKQEAHEQGKTEDAHWAHMVVHGTLHLLGFDHEKEQDAEIMEAEEIKILQKLGFKNPYEIVEKGKK